MSEVLDRSDSYLRENINTVYCKIDDGTYWVLCGIHYDLEDFYWFFEKSDATDRQCLSMVCDPEQYGFERIWQGGDT